MNWESLMTDLVVGALGIANVLSIRRMDLLDLQISRLEEKIKRNEEDIKKLKK